MSIFDEPMEEKTGGDFELPPQGNRPGVLVAMIDLGTHTTTFRGEAQTNRKLFFVWELVGTKNSQKKPFVIARDYNHTVSLSKEGQPSHLRKLISSWTGHDFTKSKFTIGKLLGLPGFVQVRHKPNADKTKFFPNVEAVAEVPEGVVVPKPFYTPFAWGVTSDEPIPTHPWLPRFYGEPIKDVIERSAEWLKHTATEQAKREMAGVAAANDETEGGDGYEPPANEVIPF